MKTTDFAKHLTAFFTEYLIGERGVSPNTIRSYSESFSLLLNFLDEQVNIKADNLRLEHITRKTVLNFLDWLQDTKKSSNATRNQRLAALRSFCTYMQYEDVKRLEQWQEILSIKVKTHEKRSVNYLSIDGIKLLLAQIPINTKNWCSGTYMETQKYFTMKICREHCKKREMVVQWRAKEQGVPLITD